MVYKDEYFFKFLEMLDSPTRYWREDVFRDEFNNIVVDTCFAPDTSKWETAVNRDGKWIVVEQYNNRELAKKGHKKWVKKLKQIPNIELVDVLWGE